MRDGVKDLQDVLGRRKAVFSEALRHDLGKFHKPLACAQLAGGNSPTVARFWEYDASRVHGKGVVGKPSTRARRTAPIQRKYNIQYIGPGY